MLGAATLALAALTTACSGSGPSRPSAALDTAGSGATNPTPSSSTQAPALPGVVDTDPADPPIINPALQPGKPAPAGYRGEPTTLKPPASWNSTPWLNRVQAAAGAKAVAGDQNGVVGWHWSADGISSLEAQVIGDGQGHATFISCGGEGFDPASATAVTRLAQTLELCAETGLSDASAQTAQAWIGKQVGPMLKELEAAPKGRQSVSAAPAFGRATYEIFGRYISSYGYLIQLLVW